MNNLILNLAGKGSWFAQLQMCSEKNKAIADSTNEVTFIQKSDGKISNTAVLVPTRYPATASPLVSKGWATGGTKAI